MKRATATIAAIVETSQLRSVVLVFCENFRDGLASYLYQRNPAYEGDRQTLGDQEWLYIEGIVVSKFGYQEHGQWSSVIEASPKEDKHIDIVIWKTKFVLMLSFDRREKGAIIRREKKERETKKTRQEGEKKSLTWIIFETAGPNKKLEMDVPIHA